VSAPSRVGAEVQAEAPAIGQLPEQMFDEPVSGPSYKQGTKFMVIGTVSSVLTYGLKVALTAPDVAWPVAVLVLGAIVVMLSSAWYMLTGRTTVDRHGVRQDWLFEKRMAWHEIAHARHVNWPRLSSRLVVSRGLGPVKAFHSGSDAVDAAFARIDGYYRRVR